MKNLKTFIAMLTFTAFSGTISAQEVKNDAGNRKSEMKQQMKLAKEKLALTPEQEPKFKEITMKYGEKMKALKNSEGDKKDKMMQLKELKTAKNSEMKSFLTPEQFITFTQMQDERKEMHRERRKQK